MEKEIKMIIVRPLKQASWSGFHRFPKCKDTVVATLGRGGYNTGLTPEDEERLENAMQLKKGELGRNSNFWKDYTVNIFEEDLRLDLSIPKDEIDYAILLGSKKVANSLKEVNEGKWPKAKYVIYDYIEEAKAENMEIQSKKKAWKKFATMNTSDMKQVLKLMGRNADSMIDEVVENTLTKIVEDSPEEFNAIVGIDNFKTRILVEDLLHVNLLRKVGSKYLYADDVIGYNLEEAVQYLNDPKNQEILITLQEKLNSKQNKKK